MILKSLLSLAAVAVTAVCAPAITTTSIDDFSTGSENWRVGNAGNPPTQVADPSFDGETGFLRHESDGGGSNGRWIMWSEESDWTGDYLDAGIGAISLWADGRTGDDLPFWLGFDGPGGWFFTPGQTLVTADDWKRFEFDISESNLIYAADSGGTGIYEDTLSGVTRFEIFAGPGSVGYAARGDLLRADRSTNVVWVDSISAIAAIPEPTALVSLAVLALPLAVAGRRR